MGVHCRRADERWRWLRLGEQLQSWRKINRGWSLQIEGRRIDGGVDMGDKGKRKLRDDFLMEQLGERW